MGLKERIQNLINRAITVAVTSEEAERAAGKVLNDNPLVRLMAPIDLTNFQSSQVRLGTTTYLTSRRMWKAYPEARALAGSELAVIYELFHVLLGTAALVEMERGDQVLVGVRSSRLAGTHAGMISIPAGLMNVNDSSIESATLRELEEETGIVRGRIVKTVAADNPDAPNVTLVSLVRTDESDIRETFEAKGKKFLWVPRRVVIQAALGETVALSREIREKGVDNSGRVAPDTFSGIRQIYNR